MKKDRKLRSERLILLPLFSAAFICFAATGHASAPKTYDLCPIFFRCLENSPLDKQERVRLFAQSVIQPYPEIYHRPQIFNTDPAALGKYLYEVTLFVPGMIKIHGRFIDQFAAIEETFYAHFPDFDRSRVKVYLMLSLFRFDGKIPHDDPRALFLALDGLAKFHGAKVRLEVILSHELFHLYHFQVNPLPATIDEIPLYRQIWQEGLATYVSRSLNSNASLADVLLDPQLARDGPKYLAMASCNLLTQLESTDDETTARYLSYRRGGKNPSRMGYLIGYNIVAKMAATRSLRDLARMRGQRQLHLMPRGVRALTTLLP